MDPLLIALFFIVSGFAMAALVLLAWIRGLQRAHPEPHWDWERLEPELDGVIFPPDFMWGTATAHHQIEGGHHDNNWGRWERATDKKGRPRIQHGDVSGDAADHWNRWQQDVALMDEVLGCDTYRFSFSWSRIEPRPGEVSREALDHYHALIDELLRRGITPMATVHHFAHPGWLEDLGSFERQDNIQHVVAFAELLFAEFGAKVPYWCTFNEPGPFSVMGWLLGVFPPGKKSPKLHGKVLLNLCRAHVAIVEQIRAMPGGADVRIGLVKNIFQMDPWRRWSPLDWVLCRVGDHVYNESILEFMRSGRFKLRVPFLVNIDVAVGGDRGDFVGLNYYANLLLDPFMSTEPPFDVHSRPGQIPTDMPYNIYAEGLHRALHRISTVGLPIYITENGIPDAEDVRRATWIRRYLFAVKRAMDEGVDVRGFYYWSLLDNFEWAEGYQMRFGLFAVDYGTQSRTLRAGAQPFVDAIARSRPQGGESP